MWEQSVLHSKTPETIPGDVNGGVIPLPLLKATWGIGTICSWNIINRKLTSRSI